ncbi:hypothetical protein LCGC14_0506380 [marine sediment metagenome]|uniref:Uncharacterized protein n=1 Tax=marine sediment metagenome TaxID=412755 RepID=A0A0F9VB03_9ZZZZ
MNYMKIKHYFFYRKFLVAKFRSENSQKKSNPGKFLTSGCSIVFQNFRSQDGHIFL